MVRRLQADLGAWYRENGLTNGWLNGDGAGPCGAGDRATFSAR